MTEKPEHSYVFDIENASEAARLRERNEFLRKAMGGPFPERADLDGIHRILDIGCGPGGWVIDIARVHSSIEVVGIDISEMMITSAISEAQTYTLENVTFMKVAALQPLSFPDQHFDLVNMRAAVEYVPRATWHELLQECYRITRPGGILRLMEADRIALTNSAAFEKYHALYAQMLHQRGYGFSPDGQTFGITPMLGKLLQNAGYQWTSMKSYAIDLSYDTLFQTDYQLLIQMRFKNVLEHLFEKNMEPPEKLADTYNDLLADIAQKTFCAITFPLIFWGEK
jgi:ubiquinone/menaquinone biosynthesis C-methylase UbiE